jgi:hypothetical protein
MKHIKTFENVDGKPTSGEIINIVEVYFSDGSDPVYGLYINGDIHRSGDDYHSRISTWIIGFVDGLKWSGSNVDFKILYCNDPEWVEDLCEMGGEPPISLSELDGKLSDKPQW